MDTFACAHCGISQIVDRKGGTVSLRLVDAITKVQAGTDKTAAELALKRLANELRNIEQHYLNLRIQKARSIDSVWKLWGGGWFGGVIVCLVIAAQGTAAAVFALFAWLTGTIAVVYLGFKQYSDILSRFKTNEAEIFKQGDDIRRKIDRNRQLVDS